MNSYFLWAAVVMSVITFYVHTFIGSPVVAKPLLANTDLPVASKWLNYYCWHVTTIFTLLMGTGYAYVALNPDRPELAVFLTINTAAFSILSAAVAVKGNINPFRFPSTSLFASVALLGLAGLTLSG
ncbi:hypothetical protein MNBD_GAMMA21-2796 [hydrothermal vent metagenome]|uniref:Uncharacterized protein n=1 Tax=hydrothermal vent metagenome TaxID=652676 RepID=A0A3B0ZUS2_9ZZZZ